MPFIQREDTTFNKNAGGKITSVKAKGTGAVKCQWSRKQYEGQEYLPDDSPELLPTLADLKKAKKAEIKAAFTTQMKTGSIQSQALGIEIDVRRNETDNDIQNIRILIDGMIATNTATANYVGKSATKIGATVAQLEAAWLEMVQYALVQLYEKKQAKDKAIIAATTQAELDAIMW